MTRFGDAVLPGPAVAEPERRQNMKLGGIRPGVARADANADIIRRGLGVVRRDLPVSIAVEHAGVEQLEFRLVLVRFAFSCRSRA